MSGIEPLYRVEGWANVPGRDRQRVELAIWPPFEEEPGLFCAPLRRGTIRGGAIMCRYGASAEQAVYIAFCHLRIEVEHARITDDAGQPIEIPVPPEPPLPEPP